MLTELKTYSVLINWDDHDREQGEYGTVVKARNEEHAEDLARREMWIFDRETYERDEESYPADDPPFGSLLDCSEGAIWKARELEEALRGLVDNGFTALELATRWSWSLEAIEKAKQIIAEIDGIGKEAA